ncbi:MAG TPA: DUF47 family protein [Nitriliruptoraceae bacterium]|nr:DUF47 family protein [Nitriliruptoraceae bacterium]
MWQRLQSMARDLAGRNDELLVDHLLSQADTAREAVGLAIEVARGDRDPADVADGIQDLEDRGDDQREALVKDLAAVLAPPIDREDLFRLSRSIEDVNNNLVDLVREMRLFQIADEPLLVPMLEAVAAGIDELRDRMEGLGDAPDAADAGSREERPAQVRRAYQDGLAELLDGDEPVTTGLVKRRQLLRRVDVLGLRLGEASDALADGIVKRNA